MSLHCLMLCNHSNFIQNAIGLGFVVPQVFYSIAMAVGSAATFYWAKTSPASYEMYLFPISVRLFSVIKRATFDSFF